MARRYTTPIETFLVKNHDLTGADGVKVTFSNKIRNVKLTIDNPTLTAVQNDTEVSVHLTQTQTAVFLGGEDVDVEVNWLDDGERMATEIGAIAWKENLLDEVWEL